MDLFIDAYGSRLSCDKGMLVVDQEEGQKRLSPAKVTSICLTSACEITTDALIISLKHEIPIVLMDRRGRNVGRWWHPSYGSLAAIRRGQFLIKGSPEGKAWLQQQLLRKADSQYELLRQLSKRKTPRAAHLPEALEMLKAYKLQLQQLEGNIPEVSFTQLEGNLTKAYFKAISQYLPREFRFQGRSRRPAKDAFNAILNYLYGILYKHAERALLLAGIDPYLGVWHSERRHAPAMVFDFVEIFRCWADWTCIQLILSGSVSDANFEPKGKGIWLSRSGRKMAVSAFQEFLHKKVQRHGKRRTRLTHLLLEAHALAQRLKEHS